MTLPGKDSGMNANDPPLEAPVLVARTGIELLEGSGWIQPVLARFPWPLGLLRVSRHGIRLTIALLGYESPGWEVAWTDIVLVKPTWTGMRVDYRQRGTHYELSLGAFGLWKRFEAACRQHGFEFVDAA
jgi:hypothetical protein